MSRIPTCIMFLLTAYAALTAGEPHLVADLRPGVRANGSGSLNEETLFNGLWYSRDIDGRIWVSDHTPEGTRLFFDTGGIRSHILGTTPDHLIFGVDKDAVQSTWATDGTPSGTRLLATDMPWEKPVFILGNRCLYLNRSAQVVALDIAGNGREVLYTGTYPHLMTLLGVSGDRLFIWDDRQDELVVTDGTRAGTRVVSDFPQYDDPYLLHVDLPEGRPLLVFRVGYSYSDLATIDAGGNLIYLHQTFKELSADAQMDGRALITLTTLGLDEALIVTDGTPTGTHTLHEAVDLRLEPLTGTGTTRYFVAASGASTLYQTDGTPEGTRAVSPAFSYLSSVIVSEPLQGVFFNGDGALYFIDAAHTTQLDVTPWSNLHVDGAGRLFVRGAISGGPAQLFVSDGTQDGTLSLMELGNRTINTLQSSNNLAVFEIRDGSNYEIWATDATPGGTHKLHDGRYPTAHGTGWLFTDDGEWFYTDGTPAGTVQLTGTGAAGGGETRGNPVRSIFYYSTEAYGYEPWVTDGTPAGTHLLADVSPTRYTGTTFGTHMAHQGKLAFSADVTPPLKSYLSTDGTPDHVASEFQTTSWGYAASSGDKIWFSNYQSGAYTLSHYANGAVNHVLTNLEGHSWWISFFNNLTFFDQSGALMVTDGTEPGTHELGPFYSGYRPQVLTDCLVYVARYTSPLGEDLRELWCTDGTTTTKLLRGSDISHLQVIGDQLFFVTGTTDYNQSPWVTDGTVAGTRRLVDASSLEPFAYAGFAEVDGLVYFTLHGSDLWRSDRTAAGTYLVADLWTGTGPKPYIKGFYAMGDTLMMLTENGGSSALWRSRGHAADTYQLKTFPAVIDGRDAAVVGDVLYFPGSNLESGIEPWRSDGTGPGTYALADLKQGAWSSTPKNFFSVGARLFFDADATDVGRELFALCDAPATNIDAPAGVCAGDTDLTASVPEAGAGAVYVWQIQNGMLTGQDGRTVTFSPDGAGDVTLSVDISLPDGCRADGDLVVPLTGAPLIGRSAVVGPEVVCAGARDVVYETADLGPGYTYHWTVPEGAAILTGAGTPRIAVAFGQGVGDVAVTAATACAAAPTAALTVTHMTPGTLAEAGDDLVTCGDSVVLDADGAPGDGFWTVAEGRDGVLSDPADPRSGFRGTSGETYLLRWTATDGLCGNAVDYVRVAFTLPPEIQVRGASGTCPGGLTQVVQTADLGAEAVYVWTVTGAEILDGQDTPRLTYRPTTGTVTVEVEVVLPGGCRAGDAVVIPAGAEMLASWWQNPDAYRPDRDADGDGTLDIRDYLHFLRGCPQP